MSQDYQPIDCDYHDELEVLVSHKQKSSITYRDASNNKITVEDYIEDIYTREGEEFIRLRKGETIRLDKLIEVNGRMIITENHPAE